MDLTLDGGHQNAIQAAEWIRYVSRRQRIVSPLTVHDESIFIHPWLNHQLHYPTAIVLFLQRCDGRLPIVEGASYEHRLCVGSIQSKANTRLIRVWKPLGVIADQAC